MADHMQDEEQVEALKRWWDENGRSTLVAVGLAIAGTVGWQQFQGYQADQAAEASERYANLLQLRESGAEPEVLGVAGEGLKTQYEDQTYAALAALQLASDAVSRRDYAAAEQELRWVIDRGVGGPKFVDLAELRLARVMASNGKESEALAILEAGSTIYPVAYAMARGDIHLVAGREADALTAYRQAEGDALLSGNVPALLESKIDSLSSRVGELDAVDEASS